MRLVSNWVGLLSVLVVGALAGCLGPLDTLGNETIVLDHEQLSKDSKLEDDKIEDKHPVFDPQRVVTETFDFCELQLNKSGSVTKLDIIPFSSAESALQGLFPSREAALGAAHAAAAADLVPSMEVVNGAMKPFNDGLYAAVELDAENGPSGKRVLLAALISKLLEALPAATQTEQASIASAVVFLGTALELGGVTPALPADLLAQADQRAAAFRTSTLFARPIGFYTWTPELENVFTQDRFLQNRTFELSFGAAAAIAVMLEADPTLTEHYQRHLSLASHLTNPFSSYPLTALFPYVNGLASLDDVPGLETRFWGQNPAAGSCGGPLITVLPASVSKDTALYCNAPPPSDVDFIDVLIAAIRDGRLDLTPGATSGWYDYQLHALETLLVPERGPESEHLLLTAAYKKKLIETFKSLITQTRETHVKQLGFGVGMAASAPPSEVDVDVYPKLPVEPFPTFYLRNARAYRFLGAFLQAAEPNLLASGHRLKEDGTSSSIALGDELRSTTALLYGLHVMSAESIGVSPQSSLLAEEMAEFPLDACRERARAWLSGWQTDADVLRDPRVMVPVAMTDSAVIYWATIGVKVFKSTAAFVPGYEPRVASGECRVKDFVSRDYYWLSEEMVEVRLRPQAAPPTRAELRALCDANQTREAIVAALEAL
jgi:hypothetical protein